MKMISNATGHGTIRPVPATQNLYPGLAAKGAPRPAPRGGDRLTKARTLLVVILCVFSAQSAWCATPEAKELAYVKARVRKAGDGFYTVRYAKYTVKTDTDRQFAAEAAIYLRKFQVAFRSFFKPKPKLKVRPTVYIFKDRPTYQKGMTERGLQKLVNASGAYSWARKLSQLYCFNDKPGESFAKMRKDTLRHEGAHQLLSYILGRHDIPIWFTEGVATFFEAWNVEKPRKWNIEQLKKGHTRFAMIKDTFDTKAFKDLHYLVSLDHERWMPEGGAKPLVLQHYAEVQSFMTFLLISPKGRDFFARIFRAVARGKNVSRMMTPKAIDGAQNAWYKDIRDRISPPETVKQD